MDPDARAANDDQEDEARAEKEKAALELRAYKAAYDKAIEEGMSEADAEKAGTANKEKEIARLMKFRELVAAMAALFEPFFESPSQEEFEALEPVKAKAYQLGYENAIEDGKLPEAAKKAGVDCRNMAIARAADEGLETVRQKAYKDAWLHEKTAGHDDEHAFKVALKEEMAAQSMADEERVKAKAFKEGYDHAKQDGKSEEACIESGNVKKAKELKRLKEFRQTIHAFDTNGDGQFDKDEVKKILDTLSGSGPQIEYNDADKIDAIMKKYDVDGNGGFDYKEVRGIITDMENEKETGKLLKKMLMLLVLILVAVFTCLLAVTLVANEASKENYTGGDGAMTSKSGNAVATSKIESYVTLWDIPYVRTADLAKAGDIVLFIDMMTHPKVKAMAAANFEVAGAFSGGKDQMFVTTREGYMIKVDSGDKMEGSITMDGRTYPIAETVEGPDARKRARQLRELSFKGSPPGSPTAKVPRHVARKEWERREKDFNMAVHGRSLEEEGVRRARLALGVLADKPEEEP